MKHAIETESIRKELEAERLRVKELQQNFGNLMTTHSEIVADHKRAQAQVVQLTKDVAAWETKHVATLAEHKQLMASAQSNASDNVRLFDLAVLTM